MRKPQAPRIARLLAIESFVDHNAERLPITHASPAFARLGGQIITLRESCASEEELRLLRLAETRRYQALRKTLVEDHLAPIVAAAKSVLVGTPEAKQLAMPRGNPPAMIFAGHASGLVAAAAAKYSEVLVAAGLPADFAPRCLEVIGEMEASFTRRSQLGFMKKGVSKGIATTLTQTRSVVTMLGIAVRKESRREPALLATWRSIATPALPAAKTALPAPESATALPAPNMKLLASTSDPAQEETPESKSRPPLLGPLGRLFGT